MISVIKKGGREKKRTQKESGERWGPFLIGIFSPKFFIILFRFLSQKDHLVIVEMTAPIYHYYSYLLFDIGYEKINMKRSFSSAV